MPGASPMASEIQRERVFGNFKPSRSVREKSRRTKKSAAERREGMCADHLASIRKLPCVACLPTVRIAGEAHHLKMTGDRGMGLRSQDKDAVPLCRAHHEDIERAGAKNEAAKFATWGIEDALQLASDLWRSRGDVGVMTKILIQHKRS